MAHFKFLQVFLSFLYIWILFSPSLGQDEGAGPVDTGNVPDANTESNMTTTNATESTGNVTTGDEIADRNITSFINTTDVESNSGANVTMETGNSTTTDDLNTNSTDNATSGSVSMDGNATVSDNSTLISSDNNSTMFENITSIDNTTTISGDNVTFTDQKSKISDSNTTVSDDNSTNVQFNVTSMTDNSTMSEDMSIQNNMTTSENMTTTANVTVSGKITILENSTTSDNMTSFTTDDMFSVNVTTNNETDIVIGGNMTSTILDDTNTTISSGSETGVDTSSTDIGLGTSSTDTGLGISGTDTDLGTSDTSVSGGFGDNTGSSTFDNQPGDVIDPFEDPFSNPFGDGTDGGDPFGEDPFGPENPPFELCTEPPCEPVFLPSTTPKPVTQPPPPPPPPPPAAATKVFDRLFEDQEKFELKRLPNFSFPPTNQETETKKRQDAYEELRRRRVEKVRAFLSSFNAGVPAAGGLSFFNPSKEFSPFTQSTGNQINFPRNDFNQRDNINQRHVPNDNNIFSSNQLRNNRANNNMNNENIVDTSGPETSEIILEQPTEAVRPFHVPSIPNPDPEPPVRTGSGVVTNGVAPPPPPPPQLDKSINRDDTFVKFFGEIGTKEPRRSNVRSPNTVNTNINFANTNTINKNNNFANTNTNINSVNMRSQTSNVDLGIKSAERQPFAWPYQVGGSSRSSTSSKSTASAQRLASSVVNEGPSLSSWLDTTPFQSDSAGGRIIDSSVISSVSSSNTLEKQPGQAASRIGIPFVGLGDLADTFNVKAEQPKKAETVSPVQRMPSTGRIGSPPVVPGVSITADSSFQSPPMDVNSNPFSARRPGVPAWDTTDPALAEFGAPSRSSMSSRNLADTWRSAQLPSASSKRSQTSGSSVKQPNKPPARDPPFIFAPKPSSQIGQNFFDNPRQTPTSTFQQPPPPPSKTDTSLFNPSQFEQPPPPKNLPFSNINVGQSGGIPPPPPPPGRIGYDASEIFAKITGASIGRSGTGESVITTKRSPRFVEDKLSASNSDPVWNNIFFNQPAVKKNPTNSFVVPSVPMIFSPEAAYDIQPSQNINMNPAPPKMNPNFPKMNPAPPKMNLSPPKNLNENLLPDTSSLLAKKEEALATTMISETTTMDTLPSSEDPLYDSTISPTESSPIDVSSTTDNINVPTETTTSSATGLENEYFTTTESVVESSTDQVLDLQESTTQKSVSTISTVPDAVASSNLLDQTSNPPDPSPVASRSELLLTSEMQPADGQAKLREFPNAAEICRNCNFINGYCRLELPGNCNRFIECSKHDKEVRAFEKECSHGLFWHQGNLTCERPLRVKCEFDPCLNRGVSNHTYIGKCRAYWSCKRSYSSARCCAKGYGYGLQDGTYGCIPMPDCQDDGHCMSKEERANLTLINANKPKVCNLMAYPNDPYKYKRGSHILPCAPGTRFDQEECTCITSQAAPISRVCAKDLYLDFEGDITRAFKDKSGRGNTVREHNVWTDNQGIAKFNKDSTITMWKYSNQNIGSSIAITFRFLSYRYPSRMQTLLSNCDQKSGIAAIDITLDTWKSAIDFKIETTQSPGNKITLPYNALQWNNVTLIYDGGSFVAAVDDAYELMFIQGEIPSKHPPLVIGGCSAKTREGLLGFVDDVAIYNGCIPEDLKNTYLFARK